MLQHIAHALKKKLHFMLIDDDQEIGECLSLFVSLNGHTSTYFSNPILALRTFQNNPLGCDGIFTDLRMPEMHGDEFIAQIREVQSDVPIVIITGTNITISEKNLQLLSIQKIINKLFDLSEIETMIQSFEIRYIFHQQ